MMSFLFIRFYQTRHHRFPLIKMSDQRAQNEIFHGKRLKDLGAARAWNWESPAGKVRFQRRVKMLTAHITKDMNVLEIGCGIGLFSKEFANTQAKITAIDISPDLLDVARQTVSSGNIHFQIENAYRLSFADQTFDTVVGSSVIHHLEVDAALKEFFRVLKPGGKIAFTEPNFLNPHIFLERKVPFLRKFFHLSPNETAFIRWELKKRLLATGFQNIHISPFDFLYPYIPALTIPFFKGLGSCLEQVPLISEIAGSLYIRATKSLSPP